MRAVSRIAPQTVGRVALSGIAAVLSVLMVLAFRMELATDTAVTQVAPDLRKADFY
jgi:hypothetical protein